MAIKPKWLVERTENDYIQLLQLDSPLQATHYPKYQYNLWLTNQARYKKELHYLGKTIICHLLQIKTENWNEAISKLATVNIKTAPREFYSTMKKLGRMGRGSNHITKMEYKNTVANSEAPVADLMAQYVEDTFQPLQEPDFD